MMKHLITFQLSEVSVVAEVKQGKLPVLGFAHENPPPKGSWGSGSASDAFTFSCCPLSGSLPQKWA